MRVDQKPTFTPLGASAPRPRAGDPAFSLRGGSEAGRTSGPAAAAPLATVDALLALQGEGDPGERRRRAIRRGHDLLDALDSLNAALLWGRVPIQGLKALASRLTERKDETGDPGLDDILAHIEMRAEVELAKLGPR